MAEYLSLSRAMWSELTSEATPYGRGQAIVIVYHLSGRVADGASRDVTVAGVFTVSVGPRPRCQPQFDRAQDDLRRPLT